MITPTLQEFYQHLSKGTPLISIDYGQKKIGIAISSPSQLIAMPLKMIFASSDAAKIQEILAVIAAHNPCGIVIGLPVSMDGSENSQCELVRKFASILSNVTNLSIFLQDERLTTRAADNFLKSFGMNRKLRNSNDDLVAASMILETALDSIKKL